MRHSTAEDSSQGDIIPLEITDSDTEEISPARLAYALRAFARLLIRAHQAEADHEANIPIRHEFGLDCAAPSERS